MNSTIRTPCICLDNGAADTILAVDDTIFSDDETNSPNSITDLLDDAPNKKTYICKICKKGFGSKAHLAQHAKKKYKCSNNDDTINDEQSIIDNYENINTINTLKNLQEHNLKLNQNVILLKNSNLLLKMQLDNIKTILNGKA